jgi:LysM repeat protein
MFLLKKSHINILTPMRHLLFLLLLICSNATTLLSEDLYLLYEPSCFDRYEYSFFGNTSVSNYVTYHLKKSDREHLILEVGNETNYIENSMPAGVRTCSQLSISDELVRRINAGDVRVFIIRKDNSGIKKIPVQLAASMSRTESYFRYVTNDATFSLNYSMLYTDTNLATDGSVNFVNYLDSDVLQDVKTYSVRKKGADANSPYSDLTILPQVGIINEKAGMSLTDPDATQMQLIEINDIPLNTFVANIRAGKSNANSSTSYSKSSIPAEYNYNNGTSAVMQGTDVNKYIDHYGSNVTEIVYLDENGNRVGTVNSTGAVNGKVPTAYDTRSTGGTIVSFGKSNTDPNLPISAPGEIVSIGSQYPVGTIVYPSSLRQYVVEVEKSAPPVSYDTPTMPIDNEERAKGGITKIYIRPKTNCPETAEDGYHIVQDGETLYSVARQYGLPVGKICNWNKISSNDVLKTCTKLVVQSKKAVFATTDDNLSGQRVAIPDNYDKIASKGNNERKIIPMAVPAPKKVIKKAEPIIEEEDVVVAPKKVIKKAAPIVEEAPVKVVKKVVKKAEPVMVEEEVTVWVPVKKTIKRPQSEVEVKEYAASIKKAEPVTAIKKAVVPHAIPTSYDTKGEKEEEELIHIVKEGETLYGLAKKMGYTEEKFREINGLKKGEEIKVGQKLINTNCPCKADGTPEKTTITKKAVKATTFVEEIPADYDATFSVKGKQKQVKTVRTYHIVREGDTLFSIAKKYEMSLDALLADNKLEKGAAISINQKLYVQ